MPLHKKITSWINSRFPTEDKGSKESKRLQDSEELAGMKAELEEQSGAIFSKNLTAENIKAIFASYLKLKNFSNLSSITNEYDYNVAQVAAKLGFARFLEQGLKREEADNAKIIVNKASTRGQTALHLAALYGHPRCVEILLDSGANPNAINKESRLPIVLAVVGHEPSDKEAKLECFKLLLDATKAESLELKDSLGLSLLLHLVTYTDEPKFIQALLEKNENLLNLKNNDGENALHLALKHGKTKIVEFFLEKHESLLKDKTYAASTCLHLACRQGNPETIRKILDLNSNEKYFSNQAQDNDTKMAQEYLHELQGFETRQDLQELNQAMSDVVEPGLWPNF